MLLNHIFKLSEHPVGVEDCPATELSQEIKYKCVPTSIQK